jgi:hypothetical protein
MFQILQFPSQSIIGVATFPYCEEGIFVILGCGRWALQPQWLVGRDVAKIETLGRILKKKMVVRGG